MKRIKYIAFLIILLLISVKVSAQTFTVGNYLDNVYYRKVSESGTVHFAQARFIKKGKTSSIVYCIDPFSEFGDGLNYNAFQAMNHSLFLSMDDETWLKINTIAYFGYGYENHTDPIWYAITQMLIWRTVEPTTHSYFTSTLNGIETNI